VYLGAPYAFFIKVLLTYQKKKGQILAIGWTVDLFISYSSRHCICG
jgi:hypothetical protein